MTGAQKLSFAAQLGAMMDHAKENPAKHEPRGCGISINVNSPSRFVIVNGDGIELNINLGAECIDAAAREALGGWPTPAGK